MRINRIKKPRVSSCVIQRQIKHKLHPTDLIHESPNEKPRERKRMLERALHTCSANQPMCLRWGCVGADSEAPR